MVARRLVVVLLGVLLCASCRDAGSGRVDPADYDAFYLWAGVRPGENLVRAKELYILDGEVRGRDGAAFEPRYPQVPRVGDRRLWLVVRSESDRWTPQVRRAVLRDLDRWAAANPGFQGLQVDFDAATVRLDSYVAFLRGLRQELPARTRLSVTGLMDWGANADPAALAGLVGVVDEVVIQTYQGRRTVPGYESYFDRLARMPVPHRIALVEGGEWREPAALADDPLFRGYVVFLTRPSWQ